VSQSRPPLRLIIAARRLADQIDQAEVWCEYRMPDDLEAALLWVRRELAELGHPPDRDQLLDDMAGARGA